MKILAKLRGLKRAADFEAAKGELAASLDDARGRISVLRAGLSSAPFETSVTDVTAMRRQIRDLEDEVETLQGVLEETERRRQAAMTSELLADVQQRMGAARKDRGALRKAWSTYDKQVAELEQTEQLISKLSDAIRVANEFARVNGHSDLTVRSPGYQGSGVNGALHQLRQVSHSPHFDALEADGRLS